MKTISILGSTGSIGINTLDVIRLNRNQFNVFALSCNKNIDLLLKQAIEFKPEYIVCSDKNDAIKLKTNLPLSCNCEILSNVEALNFIASHESVTHVVAAISGSAGMESTYWAAKTKKIILLANKESMVMAGPLIMNNINSSSAMIIPIDSEHNAIYQVLNGPSNKKEFLKRIVLTASGGPFLNYSYEGLKKVTVQEALKHPNWKMGHKVTIDSSTMMNKGLEVIEASYLFGISKNEIDVLIHPQSIIHSLVEFIDGSFLTQLGSPDMRIPISYALGFHHRIPSGAPRLNLLEKNLSFLEPDYKKFPCLSLAYSCLDEGHNFCVALNASNEVAVSAFMEQKIKFTDIFKVNSEILLAISVKPLSSIEQIKEYDNEIRLKSTEIIKNLF